MIQCNKRSMNQARCLKGVSKKCRKGVDRMPVRNRENIMSSRAVCPVATNTGARGRVEERMVLSTTVIRTRIRRRRDMLRWHFCFEKHVVVGKEEKRSLRHRRDMNVHSVWSG